MSALLWVGSHFPSFTPPHKPPTLYKAIQAISIINYVNQTNLDLYQWNASIGGRSALRVHRLGLEIFARSRVAFQGAVFCIKTALDLNLFMTALEMLHEKEFTWIPVIIYLDISSFSEVEDRYWQFMEQKYKLQDKQNGLINFIQNQLLQLEFSNYTLERGCSNTEDKVLRDCLDSLCFESWKWLPLHEEQSVDEKILQELF